MQSNLPFIGQVLRQGKNTLEQHGISYAALDAEVLLRYVLGMSRSSLFSHFSDTISEETKNKYLDLIEKRSKHMPLQYLIGSQEFMSLEFEVNQNVLIPRPETEQLVEIVLKHIEKYDKPVIVDLGTGSGAIAVSIAKMMPKATVYAVDISFDALKLAKQNAIKHGVAEQIRFLNGNLYQPLKEYPLTNQIHAIVSNPPYIAKGEISSLAPEVQKEPLIALAGGEDGLRFYRMIVKEAPVFLLSGGLLALEIGSDQGKAVETLLKQEMVYKDIAIIKDYAGLDRIVAAFLAK